MSRYRVALSVTLGLFIIGFFSLAGLAAGPQEQTTTPSTTQPGVKRPPGAPPPPGTNPRDRPPTSRPQTSKPPPANYIRNHPGVIGGPVYNEHVKRNPHPGFRIRGKTKVVRNYYYIIAPNGIPYYENGYAAVDPDVACYEWYDGDEYYPPGWYWICDE